MPYRVMSLCRKAHREQLVYFNYLAEICISVGLKPSVQSSQEIVQSGDGGSHHSQDERD